MNDNEKQAATLLLHALERTMSEQVIIGLSAGLEMSAFVVMSVVFEFFGRNLTKTVKPEAIEDVLRRYLDDKEIMERLKAAAVQFEEQATELLDTDERIRSMTDQLSKSIKTAATDPEDMN